MAHWDTSDLPLRRELLFGDRVVLARADRPRSVFAMFARAVAAAPGREALVAGSVRMTWAELDRAVAEVAAGLLAQGVARGDRVVLVIGNCAEWVILFHALMRIGAIGVPVSIREQAPGIAYIVNHCGARLLIHDRALTDRIPAPGALPAGMRVLGIDGPAGAGLAPLRAAAIVPPAEVGETETVLILYTSGTTGKPKGAMIAGVNLVHAVLTYERVMDLRDGERAVVAVPLSHVTGISGAMALMVRCAGTLIVMPEFKAEPFLALAAAERMTQAVLVPAMYALCLARADFARFDLSAWRVGGYGGAPMPAPVIEGLNRALPNLALHNLYGATETVAAQAIMPARHALSHREDVGLPVPGSEIMIMDPAGCECPPGTAGEIWMRSAAVVPGYWNDARASAETIVGGFWRSGDLGWIDADGFVRVLDRIKDMINRGGYKIYTAEVESVLAEHPGVLEAAVVARPCPVLGERVHAFVALRGGAVAEAELAAFCAARLADYKRPETFTISSEPLPRNANGKLLKRELRLALQPAGETP